MSSTLVWPIDVLPDATALTSGSGGNLKALDGTPAALVSPGAGNSVRSSTTHVSKGTSSMQIVCAGTNTVAVRLPCASHTQGVATFDIWYDTLPAATVHLIAMKDSTAATTICRFGINSTGHLIQSTNTSAGVALKSGQWSRVEISYNIGTSSTTGSFTYNVYDGDSVPGAGEPYITWTLSGINLGGTGSISIGIREFGPQSNVAFTQWVDTPRFTDNGTGEWGPYVVANALPTISAISANQNVSPSTAVSLSVTASDSDGTIASYAWSGTRYSATAVPASITSQLSSSSVANPTYTSASATGVLDVWTCTVTDNSGGQATASTEVRVPTSGPTILPLMASGIGGTGWNNVGGAGTEGGALGDGSDTTYVESPVYAASESERKYRMQPMVAGSALTRNTRSMVTATGGTTKVRIYEGSTLRQEWALTQNLSATAQNDAVTTPGAISDWGNLWTAYSVAS